MTAGVRLCALLPRLTLHIAQGKGVQGRPGAAQLSANAGSAPGAPTGLCRGHEGWAPAAGGAVRPPNKEEELNVSK